MIKDEEPLILNEAGGIFYVPLVQLGEHSTFNRGVMGSSPKAYKLEFTALFAKSLQPLY